MIDELIQPTIIRKTLSIQVNLSEFRDLVHELDQLRDLVRSLQARGTELVLENRQLRLDIEALRPDAERARSRDEYYRERRLEAEKGRKAWIVGAVSKGVCPHCNYRVDFTVTPECKYCGYRTTDCEEGGEDED